MKLTIEQGYFCDGQWCQEGQDGVWQLPRSVKTQWGLYKGHLNLNIDIQANQEGQREKFIEDDNLQGENAKISQN